MQIFINGKKSSYNQILDESPPIQTARSYWGKDQLFNKSAIDLRILLTLPLGSISLVYGPRQIGKTASLRIFLSRVSDCETLLFTDCSSVTDRRDLYSHLNELLQGPTTVILDEVQSVPEWHLALRALHGEGKLSQCRVVCTGSEARYLLESGERLPGRKGAGKNIFARPWSFREYVDFFYREEASPFQNLSMKHLTSTWLTEQPPRLQQAWNEYSRYGGIPRAVAEFRKIGNVSDETYSIYFDWILGIWSRLRTPERSLRMLCKRIVETMNSRVTFEALKKNTDIQSANTVRTLIEMLEDHFALNILPRMDPQTHKFLPAKMKKVYPLDPFIAQVFRALGDNKRRMIDSNVSSTGTDECAFNAQTYRYEKDLNVAFLYSDRTHCEIDFWIDSTAFELKSEGKPTKGQQELLKSCEHHFLVNREKIPIVAYLLGEGRNNDWTTEKGRCQNEY